MRLTPTPYQGTLSNTVSATPVRAIVKSPIDGLGVVAANFPAGTKPVLTLTSRVATKNHIVDLSRRRSSVDISRAELERFTRATRKLPTDGIVKATATDIQNTRKPIWTKLERFTTGLSRILSAIRRRADGGVQYSCSEPVNHDSVRGTRQFFRPCCIW